MISEFRLAGVMQNDIPNTFISKKPGKVVLKRRRPGNWKITDILVHFSTFKLHIAKQTVSSNNNTVFIAAVHAYIKVSLASVNILKSEIQPRRFRGVELH